MLWGKWETKDEQRERRRQRRGKERGGCVRNGGDEDDDEEEGNDENARRSTALTEGQFNELSDSERGAGELCKLRLPRSDRRGLQDC